MDSVLDCIITCLAILTFTNLFKKQTLRPIFFFLAVFLIYYIIRIIPGVKDSIYESLILYPYMIACYILIMKCDFLEAIVRILVILPLLAVVEFISLTVMFSVFNMNITEILTSDMNKAYLYILLIAIELPLVLTGVLRKLMDHFWYFIKNASLVFINFFVLLLIQRAISAFITNSIDFTNNTVMILWGANILITIIVVFYIIRQTQKESMFKQYEFYKTMTQPLLDELRSRQHDINNHFQVISQVLSTGDPLSREQIREYSEKVRDDINAYSLMTKTPNPMLGALLYSKKIVSEDKAISFNVTGHQDAIPYPLEDYELIAVLANLLDNAIEATEESGAIHVAFSEKDDNCIIEISNTGEIPKLKHSIFEKGASSKAEGRGFGLANVKRIVTHHRGKIEVYCADTLVTFQIRFPVAS